MRRIRTVVAAKPKLGGALRRVIGSTDFLGQGTEFEIAEVGPFIMLEDVHGLEGPGQPPFGMHPHTGLVALSWVPTGDDWCSHTAVSGVERVDFKAGQVLVTVAGRGITHDEVTAGAGLHDLMQIILRMPTRLADAVPSVETFDSTVIGPGVVRAFDAVSLEGSGIDAEGYHIHVQPESTAELELNPSHTTGFVYARHGAVEVNGTLIPAQHIGVLTAEGDTLRVTGTDGAAEVFVGLGAAIHDPWVKLLGNEGFLIATDQAAAHAKMSKFEADPGAFGS